MDFLYRKLQFLFIDLQRFLRKLPFLYQFYLIYKGCGGLETQLALFQKKVADIFSREVAHI